MKKNVGTLDRVIRLVLAAALVGVGLVGAPQGLWWVAVVAVVPLVTGLLSYCPVWHLFGVKTISVRKL